MANEKVLRRTGPSFWGGVVAGLIGGIPMGIAASFKASTVGFSMGLPMEQVAALFYGVDALLGGASVLTVGVSIHLVTSMVYGGIFGIIFVRVRSAAVALIVGLIYGIAIWAFMTYFVLHQINTTMGVRVALIPFWWFIYHLIYGAMLGFTPLLANAFGAAEPSSLATAETVRG